MTFFSLEKYILKLCNNATLFALSPQTAAKSGLRKTKDFHINVSNQNSFMKDFSALINNRCGHFTDA